MYTDAYVLKFTCMATNMRKHNIYLEIRYYSQLKLIEKIYWLYQNDLYPDM